MSLDNVRVLLNSKFGDVSTIILEYYTTELEDILLNRLTLMVDAFNIRLRDIPNFYDYYLNIGTVDNYAQKLFGYKTPKDENKYKMLSVYKNNIIYELLVYLIIKKPIPIYRILNIILNSIKNDEYLFIFYYGLILCYGNCNVSVKFIKQYKHLAEFLNLESILNTRSNIFNLPSTKKSFDGNYDLTNDIYKIFDLNPIKIKNRVIKKRSIIGVTVYENSKISIYSKINLNYIYLTDDLLLSILYGNLNLPINYKMYGINSYKKCMKKMSEEIIPLKGLMKCLKNITYELALLIKPFLTHDIHHCTTDTINLILKNNNSKLIELFEDDIVKKLLSRFVNKKTVVGVLINKVCHKYIT